MIFLTWLTYSAPASDWFVTPTGAGSKTGMDWNNAWAGSSTFAGVRGGDTIWLAGGNYGVISLSGVNGASGNNVNVKRVLSSDSIPTAAAGWSPAFDSLVNLNGSLNVPKNNFLTVDGRINYGIRITLPATGSAVAIYMGASGNCTNVNFFNIEILGPYNTANTSELDGFWAASSVPYNYDSCDVSNCWIHGFDTLIKVYGYNQSIIEHCKLWDSITESGPHPDVVFLYPCTNFVFRYNSVSNCNAEAIFEQYGAGNLYFYGNTFQCKNSCTLVGIGGTTVYFCNNTVQNGGTYYGIGVSASVALYCENNIFSNCTPSLTGYSNNCYYPVNINGYNAPFGERFSTGSAVNPFSDGLFNLKTNIGPGYARNAGVVIPNVAGQTFNLDANGNVRGADGAWDVGAYEYTDKTVQEPVILTLYSRPVIGVTNAITINWTTDENATSIVNYGNSTAYGYSVTNSNAQMTNSLNITNMMLYTGKTYFQVQSIDSLKRVNNGYLIVPPPLSLLPP